MARHRSHSAPAKQPKLYRELASWWPLLSAPEEYAEEAAFYRRLIVDACARPPETLLELGSGGGNNASHLKAQFRMTLVDISPAMLKVSASRISCANPAARWWLKATSTSRDCLSALIG